MMIQQTRERARAAAKEGKAARGGGGEAGVTRSSKLSLQTSMI